MTREEAIRMLTRLKDQINFEWTDAQKKTDALNIAIEALQNEPRWIPCSERLPEERSRYLVTVNWRDHVYVDIDDYYCYGWDDYKDAVLAWCELPEPWRGDTE